MPIPSHLLRLRLSPAHLSTQNWIYRSDYLPRLPPTKKKKQAFFFCGDTFQLRSYNTSGKPSPAPLLKIPAGPSKAGTLIRVFSPEDKHPVAQEVQTQAIRPYILDRLQAQHPRVPLPAWRIHYVAALKPSRRRRQQRRRSSTQSAFYFRNPSSRTTRNTRAHSVRFCTQQNTKPERRRHSTHTQEISPCTRPKCCSGNGPAVAEEEVQAQAFVLLFLRHFYIHRTVKQQSCRPKVKWPRRLEEAILATL